MDERKPSLKVSRDVELVSPGEEKGFCIPVSEWSILGNKIKRMKSPDSLFLLLGTTFFGISVSNMFFALFTEIQKSLQVILWVITIALLVISGLSLLFHFLIGTGITHSKEDVLEEMDRIARTYSESD